jgi:hypothetical protein
VDPEPLIEWRSRYTLLTDDTTRSLGLDTSGRKPDQVADDIIAFARGG